MGICLECLLVAIKMSIFVTTVPILLLIYLLIGNKKCYHFISTFTTNDLWIIWNDHDWCIDDLLNGDASHSYTDQLYA